MDTLNTEKKWSWSSFFLGIFVAALCLFIIKEAHKEVIAFATVSRLSHRDPASIKRSFDFSDLEGSTLERAVKKRLLKSIKIENESHASLIQLGNFVLLNDQKEKKFACGVYDHLTFNFEAEGVAIEGSRPVLIIDSPCDVAGNINDLSPIKIPFETIQAIRPSLAGQVSFKTENKIKIQTKNSPESWPRHWVLTEITFSREGSPFQNLHISQNEIADLINKPIMMNW